jgi:hypothetical protein
MGRVFSGSRHDVESGVPYLSGCSVKVVIWPIPEERFALHVLFSGLGDTVEIGVTLNMVCPSLT